ncbi:hypothetical protein [Rhodoferax sp. UBA5149]|uniref:hypothetical protein n=1 Tax=Rhodoferax sp. UBA5149 TaxID=1947379 RepID=UPI0025E80D73|nr:hypothetical protein [Rhodoferax sp. UBA5149]
MKLQSNGQTGQQAIYLCNPTPILTMPQICPSIRIKSAWFFGLLLANFTLIAALCALV